MTAREIGAEKAKMIIFITAVLTVMSLIWFYVWKRLILTMALPMLGVKFFGFILAISFLLQIYRLAMFRNSDVHPKLLLVTYFMFGLMIHFFFAALTKDLIVLPLSFANIHFDPRASLVFAVLALVANLWGTWIGLVGPDVKEVKLQPSAWPQIQNDFKIVQISDLHVGPIIRRDYVKNVVNKINALQADMIVMTGDIGDGNVDSLHDDLEPLRFLKAKHGIYYSPGNHEYYWDGSKWFAKMQELGFRVLLNQGERVKLEKRDIWIGGVHDYSVGRMDPKLKSDPAAAIQQWDAHDTFKILLAHQPKSCDDAVKAGFDLMLSGHTHAGQFFPFSLVVGFFNPYVKGLNRHDERMWVYVNVGTGFWGPPLRLGVPSEITLLKLQSGQ